MTIPSSSGGNADLVICIYGDESVAAALAQLTGKIDPAIKIAVVAPAAYRPYVLIPGMAFYPCLGTPGEALTAMAVHYPGRNIVLLHAATQLPDAWLPRLLAALDAEPVADVVSPLCQGWSAGDPTIDWQQSDNSIETLDTLCWLRGTHNAAATNAWSPALSLWRGEALARFAKPIVGGDPADCVAGFQLPPGCAGVLCDCLCVANPSLHHSDEKIHPPAAMALLAKRLSAWPTGHWPRVGLDGRPVLLHVLHGWGGGARRFVEDLARADTARCHLVLIARAEPGSAVCAQTLELYLDLSHPPLQTWPLSAPIAATAIRSPEYAAILARIVAQWQVGAVLVSSLIGHAIDALETGLPTAVVCHDYYPVWPVLHANFDDEAFDFSAAALPAALNAAGDFPFSERRPLFWRALRERYVAVLTERRIPLAVPSKTLERNLLRIEPALVALPHQLIEHGFAGWPQPLPGSPPPTDRAALRVVVPGRLHGGKGEHLLAGLLEQQPAGVEFVLLGAGHAGMRFFGRAGVHVVLDYRREQLPELLATLRPDAALLLSTAAETYSYMLSELWSLQMPVIATRRGSFAERIRPTINGYLVEPDAPAIATFLRELVADRSVLARLREQPVPLLPTLQQMATAYRDLLPALLPAVPGMAWPASPDTQHAAAAELALHHLRDRFGRLQQCMAEQEKELEQRAAWGHGLAQQLEQRTVWAKRLEAGLTQMSERLAALQAEFNDRSTWAFSLRDEVTRLQALVQSEQDRLHAEIAHLQDDLAKREAEWLSERNALLNSASWRITRPLRGLRRRIDAAHVRLRYYVQRLATLRHRGARSLSQRGVRGSWQRLRQEFERPSPEQAPQVPRPAPFAPFALPVSEQPLASIVIPVYNHFDATLVCLRSLAENTGRTPFEVIVVDDCSSDQTAPLLPQIGGLRVLRNDNNLGFIGACNRGAAAARGAFVIFLNNDTAVQPGWLDALIGTFDAVPDAGLVGAKLVYPDGRLQEAGGIVFSDGSGWNYGRFGDPADPRYNYLREVDYCSGAAIALRRELFERLGGFDSYYAPAYYEDTDLAMKVRAEGLRVLYQPASVVVHFEGVTSGTDTGSGVKSFQVINQKKFFIRWQQALATHAAPGTDIAIAREHRARHRVLVIDATVPTPDQDSGSLRLFNIFKLLRAEGAAVTFFADNRAHIDGYTAQLQQIGVEVLWHPFLSDPVSWLVQNGKRFDAVFVSRHYIACNYLDLVRLHAPQARFVFDTVDLHYLREQRAAELSGREDQRRQALQTRARELALIRQADITLVVSPVEQALLAREVSGARVDILSNVHEVQGRRVDFAGRRDLVFVGGFQHPPNIDAAIWFVETIFPLIRQRLPETAFHLIGSKANETVRALGERPGVKFHGYVADIAPYMDGCRLAVAPLRYGAGVKGKVNLSMAYGQPVVATSAAVEGMFVESGCEVLVADTPEDFAEAVIHAYEDRALWTRLSDAGLDNVRRYFSFDAARGAIRRLLA